MSLSAVASTLLTAAAGNDSSAPADPAGAPAWDIADAAIWEAAARLLASAAIIAATLVALSVVSLLMRFCTRSVLTIDNVPRRHVTFYENDRAQPALSSGGGRDAGSSSGVYRLQIPLERGRFRPRRPLRDRVHDAERRGVPARLPRLHVGGRATALGDAGDDALRRGGGGGGGGWRRLALGMAWHEHNSLWDAVDRLLRRCFTLTDSRVALFEHLLHAVVITGGLVAVLNIHGLTLWQLVVSFGMMTYLIAFSSNMIIENLICGLIMLFSEEVRMNDLVDPDGSGWVRIVNVGYIKTQVEDVNSQVQRILAGADVTGRIGDGAAHGDGEDDDSDGGGDGGVFDDIAIGDDGDDDGGDMMERGIVLHHTHQQQQRRRRHWTGESANRVPPSPPPPHNPRAPRRHHHHHRRRRVEYLVKRWRNVPNSTFFKRTTTHLLLRCEAD